ncbi:MAG: Crp/Fnr family transcriptional regulator [Lentimicrobiaceae bacterium]|jgi:CRP/FNR family transcriptional regulator
MSNELFANLHDTSSLFQLFGDQYLKREDIELIKEHSQKLIFSKGEVLIKQGSKSTHVVFLFKGIIKHTYQKENYKNMILTITSAPSLIGGANMFNNGKNIFSVIAVEDCEAFMIDINILKQLLMQNSQLALQLFDVVSEMSKDSILNFINLAHKHVNGKVADILLYLSESVYKSQKFTLSMTRRELSEFAGISEINFISTLKKFEKDGILNAKCKEIEIINKGQLELISKLG